MFSVPSPRVSAASDFSLGFVGAGRVGQSVLRLVGRNYIDRPGRQIVNVFRLGDADRMVGTHIRSISCAEQKLGFDERAKQSVAHCAIQAPESLRLRNRQAKTRHLDVLALHTPKHVERLFFCHFLVSRWAVLMNRRRGKSSNRCATGTRARATHQAPPKAAKLAGIAGVRDVRFGHSWLCWRLHV